MPVARERASACLLSVTFFLSPLFVVHRLTPRQEASLQSIPFALAAALIIGFLAGFAAGGAWGASTCDDDKSVCWAPMEPINPGMTPGTEKPRIILGIDVDYPPYGTLA